MSQRIMQSGKMDEKTLQFIIGETNTYVRMNDIWFDMRKWYRTKDLHPKYYVIQMILDLIENKKIFYNGLSFTKMVTMNIPFDKELIEIDKVKKDSNLYNILVHQYFNSNKGFNYIMENIENNIKNKDYVKTTFGEE